MNIIILKYTDNIDQKTFYIFFAYSFLQNSALGGIADALSDQKDAFFKRSVFYFCCKMIL